MTNFETVPWRDQIVTGLGQSLSWRDKLSHICAVRVLLSE